MIKFIYMLKKRESTDFLMNILMILKLLLNTQMIWMMFIKTLKNTTQIKNVKY